MRIKNLASFVKLSALVEQKLATLRDASETMLEDDHYASGDIREIMDGLLQR